MKWYKDTCPCCDEVGYATEGVVNAPIVYRVLCTECGSTINVLSGETAYCPNCHLRDGDTVEIILPPHDLN